MLPHFGALLGESSCTTRDSEGIQTWWPEWSLLLVTAVIITRDTTLVQLRSRDSSQPIRILLETNLSILLEKGYFGRFIDCNKCTILVQEVERSGGKAGGIWELCVFHSILL